MSMMSQSLCLITGHAFMVSREGVAAVIAFARMMSAKWDGIKISNALTGPDMRGAQPCISQTSLNSSSGAELGQGAQYVIDLPALT